MMSCTSCNIDLLSQRLFLYSILLIVLFLFEYLLSVNLIIMPAIIEKLRASFGIRCYLGRVQFRQHILSLP